MANQKHIDNPWKGLKFYNEGEVLYGRNSEIQALSQYVINNTQTVLYGKSGIGKSSILNAGVFPIARRNGLFPVSIRLEHKSGLSYIQQFYKSIISSGLEAHEVVPVINTEEESLWEFMHRQYFTLKGSGVSVQPLFVIDQFEEIFTLQHNEKIKLMFFSQLADLINDVCPLYINESLNKNATITSQDDKVCSDILSDLDNFTFDLGDEHESSSNYISSPLYHIVFALREDFLSYLERYTTYIPAMKNNRFALLPINEEQAAQIIMDPIPGMVDVSVAEHIIKKVTGRNDFTLDGVPEIDVDSAVLSLYLSRLYAKKKDNEVITMSLVDEFGDNIIKDFYHESISSLDSNTIDIIEDKLLTQDGRRNNVSRSDLIADGVNVDTLEYLINDKKILRQFSYGEDIRIEFIHDILCNIVLEHKENKELLLIKEREQEEIHLQNRKKNQNIRKQKMNVLTPFGRKLIDNAIDFGSSYDSFYHAPRYYYDDWIFMARLQGDSEYMLSQIQLYSDSFSKDVFHDSKLEKSVVCYEFKDEKGMPICSMDGIYSMNITYDNQLIKKIDFWGKLEETDGTYKKRPYYLLGGYCGIVLNYTIDGLVKSMTYINEVGVPTLTIDGYAIVQFQYDENDNPIHVRFYDEDMKPCCHINGNHGFDSSYDIEGDEIYRQYVSLDNTPMKVTSGVYGRKMTYRNCLVTGITNVDANGSPMFDCEGYCGVKFEYDKKNRIVKETYLDDKGIITKSGDDTYSIDATSYADDDSWELHQFYGNDNHPIKNKNNNFYKYIEKDEFHRIKCISGFDENQSPVDDDDGVSKMSIEWNESGLMSSMSRFDMRGNFLGGMWFEYNHTKTHIQRIGSLSSDGKRKSDSDCEGFYGIDLYLDGDPNLPIIQRYIDENGNVVINNDGYIGKREWEDERERVIKEAYYGDAEDPMPDNMGVFGMKVDYFDENNSQRITFLDEHLEPTSNNFGVSQKENIYDSYGNLIKELYYDIHNTLCKNENGVYGREINREGNKCIMTYLSADGKAMNNNDGIAIVEELYDNEGRILQSTYKNERGRIVENAYGDCMTFYEYDDSNNITRRYSADSRGNLRINNFGFACLELSKDDNGNIVKEAYYDCDGNICMNSAKGFAIELDEYDGQNRLTYSRIEDANGNALQLKDGSYGKRYAYDNGVTIQYHLDAMGDVAPCDYGYAIRKYSYNSKGQLAKEIYYDKNENIYVGELGVSGALYDYKTDNNGRRIVLTTNLNSDGQPTSDRNGDMIIEKTYDSKERVVFERTFDVHEELTIYSEGVYGIKYEYDDDENSKKTIVVDRRGERTARKDDGLSVIQEWFDDQNRIIRHCRLDLEDNLLPHDDGSYIIEREYIDSSTYKTYYKASDGTLLLNNEGRAIELTREDEKGITVFLRWYDTDGEPVPDEFGDYGRSLEYDEEEHIDIITKLDENGVRHKDKRGVCVHFKQKDERGRLIRELWFDENDEPVSNTDGEFGFNYDYPDEGDIKKEVYISLGSNGEAAPNRFGCMYQCVQKDDSGRISIIMAYDADMNPVVCDDYGNYGIRYIYTDDPNSLIIESLDNFGMPFENDKGFTRELRIKYGEITKSIFFNTKGECVEVD